MVLQNILRETETAIMVFGREQREEEQHHYKKRKQIWYFNIIKIAESWCEIGCIYEGSIINQSWSMQFPVANFSKMALFDSWAIWCLCDMWKGRSYVNVNVFCLFNIQQWLVLS